MEIITRSEAKAQGLKFYTGRPCQKAGHTKRYASNSLCVECHLGYNRKYYKDNREEVRAQQGEYRENNLEVLMLCSARRRAKKSGIACTITAEDILIPDRCPILGIELEAGFENGRDNSPSLDRLVPEVGYVPGNVTVISYRANQIKNNGTAEEHRAIADWMDVNV